MAPLRVPRSNPLALPQESPPTWLARFRAFHVCACTAILLGGCSVTDRMDEMNGRMREMNDRMARMNAHLVKMSDSVGKLDETNRHLATMSEQAQSMDRRLGTMEKIARQFGMGSASRDPADALILRQTPARPLAKVPPQPRAAANMASTPPRQPAETQASPDPLPILIPPAVLSSVPEE